MKACLKYFLEPGVRAKGISLNSPRPGDAGFDVRASETIIIETGKQAAVPTGLKVAIPQGWVGIVKDRSSMALKRIYTHAGVIDSGYRGEVKVILSNHGEKSYHIVEGDKIAQMVLVPCLVMGEEVSCEEDLGETERGEGGFGSTGV